MAQFGSMLAPKMDSKSSPKASQDEANKKNEAKNNQEAQKPIQDDLGPVLGRSWAVLGALLGLWNRSKHYACRCFVNIHFFDVKTVRRRSWDQLWPTKAPKRPKMTPKTEPKSTPRRSKIDVKIVIKNDAKTKRARQVLGRRHRAGTPPRDPLGGAPGTQGRRPRPHGTSKKS